jgi:cytochrome c556
MPGLSRRAPIIGLALVLVSSLALAAGLTGVAALKDRQAHMKALGAAGKALSDQLRSGKPDGAIVKVQTAKIAALAGEMPTWFPAGSGPETGVKTRALPLIWTDGAEFSADTKGLKAAADKLDAAAASGDMSAVGPAVQGVGKACTTCHDKFRGKENG